MELLVLLPVASTGKVLRRFLRRSPLPVGFSVVVEVFRLIGVLLVIIRWILWGWPVARRFVVGVFRWITSSVIHVFLSCHGKVLKVLRLGLGLLLLLLLRRVFREDRWLNRWHVERRVQWRWKAYRWQRRETRWFP